MEEKGERESKTQFQQDQQTGIKCHEGHCTGSEIATGESPM